MNQVIGFKQAVTVHQHALVRAHRQPDAARAAARSREGAHQLAARPRAAAALVDQGRDRASDRGSSTRGSSRSPARRRRATRPTQQQQALALQDTAVGATASTGDGSVAPPSQYGGVVGIAMRYLGMPLRLGRREPRRLRLLRPRRLRLRAGRRLASALHRRSVELRRSGLAERPPAGRPRLLRRARPRRHLHRRRPVHPRAAHGRRRQDLELMRAGTPRRTSAPRRITRLSSHCGRMLAAAATSRRASVRRDGDAGISHHALTPPATRAAVAPIAITTPAAARQSSPTTKSHQNRPNARMRLMRTRPAGAASIATAPNESSTTNASTAGSDGVVAGPVARRLPRPTRRSRRSSASRRRRTSSCSRARASSGRADEHADDRDEHERDAGAERGEPDAALRAAERDDDERDLEPFQQHALEREREAVPVEPGALARRAAARASSSSRAKIASSSCSALKPLARRIALRSHCSPKASSSPPTTSRSAVIGIERQRRAERGDDHRERDGRGAEARRAPSASRA